MDAKRLPPHPNLVQYKKQAKDFVKSRQSGDPETMRRIRHYHPRLGRLSDMDAREAEFLLADAQLVLAREHGFSSWAKFTHHIEALMQHGSPAQRTQAEQGFAPSDTNIRQILTHYLARVRQSAGIVVGILEPTGQRLVTHGVMDEGDQRPPNGDTVFEIGIVTMVFTTLLLMDLVQRGEVALSDPVRTYLPTAIGVPQRNGREITLQDLATHRSGLPLMPSDFRPKDPTNPFADFTVEDLYRFLSTHQLTRDIDAKVEYSIVGFGLLGHVLGRRAGMDYEALLRARILDPLGMSGTGITLSPDMSARLAPGHNPWLKRVSHWECAALAGACGLRSTVNDLLRFLAEAFGRSDSLVHAAMTKMLRVRRTSGKESPIGWLVATLDGIFARNGRDMLWLSGGTSGHRSFLGFDPTATIGVAVLANCSIMSGEVSGIYDVDNIGLHLLDPRWPVSKGLNDQIAR
jgi:D-alanyl-D-alanine-carboxypeptidase/D-alanyl-D-alanine-endopeptidase